MTKPSNSSWENSAVWYDKAVGEKGHYYHEHLILPKVLKLLDLKKEKACHLLDIACGQGILSRNLPAFAEYVGLDISSSLIASAKKYKTGCKSSFFVKDATEDFFLNESFTHATIILALQNMEEPLKVFKNARKHLLNGGQLICVLNHPCFRIPRQSSWQIDTPKKIQYRRIDLYCSSLKIPIQTHPGKEKSVTTYSFHYPLSTYSKWLKEAGFSIELIEEWCSDKKSEGKMAKMEDKSRLEFPLFLTLVAKATH